MDPFSDEKEAQLSDTHVCVCVNKVRRHALCLSVLQGEKETGWCKFIPRDPVMLLHVH